MSKTKTSSTVPTTTSGPSAKELYAWTLRTEAVAPCFIRDALTMRECDEKGAFNYLDFFWLGSVPCRSVRIVGLIVGVQAYESRVVYSVDDGTAVIDCIERRLAPLLESPSKKQKEPTLYVSMKPVAYVGTSIKIIGRVAKWHEGRQLRIDTIAPCASSNDEPLHWRTVISLHKTRYSRPGPFIPDMTPFEPTPTPCLPSSMTLANDESKAIPPMPSTPSTSRHPQSVQPSIPSSPPKLRHPSKLHSRDLTSATFVRYMKHYMNNYSHCYGDTSLTSIPSFGFTISHLRRVPELHLMAKRVVLAEAKRRAKDEKKKLKSASSSSVPSTSSSSAPTKSSEPIAKKIKRLFGYALVKLREDGEIVLWDGPSYDLPQVRQGIDLNTGDADLSRGHGSSKLWKSTATNESSIFSTQNTTTLDGESAEDDDDTGAISDPDPEEEAYVPLTTEYLADEVVGCITSLMTAKMGWHRRDQCPNSHHNSTPLDKAYSADEAQPWCLACPHRPGPTISDIITFMKRRNSKWERVGDWAIDEALGMLKRDGRTWEARRDSWELIL